MPLRDRTEQADFLLPLSLLRAFCVPDAFAGRKRRPAQRDLRTITRILRDGISLLPSSHHPILHFQPPHPAY